jgi:hypothetical protein
MQSMLFAILVRFYVIRLYSSVQYTTRNRKAFQYFSTEISILLLIICFSKSFRQGHRVLSALHLTNGASARPPLWALVYIDATQGN